MSPDVVIKENMEVRHDNVIEEVRYHTVETKSTKTTIPFLKNNNFDYANLVNWAGDYKEEAAWLVFVLMVIFVVTAVSNGANMTDGLDGLAAGTSAIIGVALGILAYMSSHFEFAFVLEYHVYTRRRGVGGLCRCLYRCHGRFPMVQLISGPSIYGRHG